MRRVNVINGIKQRLNDILGNGSNGILTLWSMQAAMLNNFQRMCLALLGGSSTGRVVSGLVTSYNASSITVNPGYGITVAGNFITLPSSQTIMVSDLHDDSDNYLCLKYSLVPLKDADPSGKKTSIINESATTQIVYDESGAADSFGPEIFVAETSLANVQAQDYYVYFAKAVVSGGVITSVTDINNDDGAFRDLSVSGTSAFSGIARFYGETFFSDDVTFANTQFNYAPIFDLGVRYTSTGTPIKWKVVYGKLPVSGYIELDTGLGTINIDTVAGIMMVMESSDGRLYMPSQNGALGDANDYYISLSFTGPSIPKIVINAGANYTAGVSDYKAIVFFL